MTHQTKLKIIAEQKDNHNKEILEKSIVQKYLKLIAQYLCLTQWSNYK